jgi:DNA-binding MarR family transcriptional regulator
LRIGSLGRVSDSPPPLFGDVLALARQSWIGQMAGRLGQLGYHDYRRSDAIVFRYLQRGPAAIGRLGAVMGVTRQAARKVVDGLEERGFASTTRDQLDGRRLNVTLTPAGARYARAVVEVIVALNDELGRRVDPEQLGIARLVLHEVIAAGAVPADAR